MRLNDFQITPNFNLREFQCPCCHAVVLHRRLAAAMQRPVRVSARRHQRLPLRAA